MRVHSYLERYFACCFLLVAACLGITVGCAMRQKSLKQTITSDVYPIYFVAHDSSTAQIWKISLDSDSPSLIYEIVGSADRSADSVLPSEEVEKLESYLASQSLDITIPIDNLFPQPYIERLTLSPTGGALAWVEGDTYCVEGSAMCFGVKRLVALDLSTGNSEILLKIPFHADGSIVYNNISGGPIWSPDGQRVAIMQSIRGGPVEALLVVVDVSTRQSQEIIGTIDSTGPLVWFSNGITVAWPLSRWHTQSPGGAIRLCTLDTEECKNIELNGLWIWGWGIDCAPNGRQLVFASVDKSPNTFKSTDVELHLLDTSTGLVQDVSINIDGILENPRWSPDGRLIAADYRPKVDDFFQSLVVIEPISGKIVSQLQVQRADSSWIWGYEGQTILVLIGTNKLRLEVGIFDVRDGSLRIILLPDELTTKRISYLTW